MNPVLALVLALAVADVAWTDESGRCPAASGRAAVEAAGRGLDDATITIRVKGAGEGLTATLRLETVDGVDSRTLASPSCDTLVEAAALITQAAVHASVPPLPAPALQPEPEPEPQPEPEPELQPELQPEPELQTRVVATGEPQPGPTRSRQAPQDLRAFIRGVGFATFGLTPRWSGGGGFAVGATGPHWTAELFGMVASPSQTALTPGIRAWGWSAGVRGCGTLGPYGRLQPGLCVGLESGQLRGESTGADVTNRQPHADTWVGASLGPSVRVYLLPERLAIVADVEALAVLYRPGFALDGDEVFRAATIAPRISLGLEVQFGGR